MGTVGALWGLLPSCCPPARVTTPSQVLASRAHHLHLVRAGARRYADELAFRDRLRADPRVAADYAALKRKLAARFAQDRES